MDNHTLFDTYLMVDWSAKDEPGPQERKEDKLKKDNIWIGEADRGKDGPSFSQTYCRTRNRALKHLETRLQALHQAGKRVLVGFDFAFGYPAGFAELLTGKANWQGVWEFLTKNLEDDELNENNRFELADRINAKFEAPGPFWGLGRGYEFEFISPKSPWKGVEELTFQETTLSRLRHTDRMTKGTQEVWKLYGAGSVGSQALTGIPVVWKLRNLPKIKEDSYIWPFETMMLEKEVLAKSAKIVFAEIFPTLADKRVRELSKDREAHGDKPKDQIQVWAMTEQLAEADQAGELMNWFVEAAALPKVIRSEEAAILQPSPLEGDKGPERAPKKKANKKMKEDQDPSKEKSPDHKDEKKKPKGPHEAVRELEKKKRDKERLKAEREKEKEEKRKQKDEEKAAAREKREAEKEKARLERDKIKEEARKKREEEKAKRLEANEAKRKQLKAEREKEKAAKDKARNADKEKLKAEKDKAREEKLAARKAEMEKEKERRNKEREAKAAARKEEMAKLKAEREAQRLEKEKEKEARKAEQKAKREAERKAREDKRAASKAEKEAEKEADEKRKAAADKAKEEAKAKMEAKAAEEAKVRETGTLKRQYERNNEVGAAVREKNTETDTPPEEQPKPKDPEA